MGHVEQQVTELVAREVLQDRPDVVLTPTTALIDDDIIDSLAIVLLVDVFQDQFGVDIEPEDVVPENFETISAIARLIEEKLAASKG